MGTKMVTKDGRQWEAICEASAARRCPRRALGRGLAALAAAAGLAALPGAGAAAADPYKACRKRCEKGCAGSADATCVQECFAACWGPR